MPTCVQHFSMFTHLIFTTYPWGRYYYSHLADKETKAKQWSKVKAWNLKWPLWLALPTKWHHNSFVGTQQVTLSLAFFFSSPPFAVASSLNPSCVIIPQSFWLLSHCTFLSPFCCWSLSTWDHSDSFYFTLLFFLLYPKQWHSEKSYVYISPPFLFSS